MIARSTCLFFAILVLPSANIAAELTTGPRVAGFERFYAAELPKPDDEDEPPIKLDPVTGGRLLLGELNCTSCHMADENVNASISLKQAPVLDEVGSRVKTTWLRSYLANPHQTKPGTTMPNVMETLPEKERDAAVEALTHLLASTGIAPESRADAAAAAKGAAFFRKVGCQACHNSSEEGAADFPTSVSLSNVGKKYTAPSVMSFLKDTLKARPSGRMPTIAMTEEELRVLGHFLVPDGTMSPNVKYSVYHGEFKMLPNFGELKPVTQGQISGFDLSVADRPDNYAIRFETNLKIVKTGEYRFWLGSNDGSKLIIDDRAIVDNDGEHLLQFNPGTTTLSAGFHKVVVEYFQAGLDATLQVSMYSQDLTRQPLVNFCHLEPTTPASSTAENSSLLIDPALVAKGKNYFASLGCAACHQLKIDGQSIATKLKAKPVADLNPAAGCLAETVAGQAPRFGLNATQRGFLATALKASAKETPAETVHRELAAFNCYACHERGKLGGVEPARNAAFESLQKDMGDEGRLPPGLTGVGDKLRPEWLKTVLNNGADDRKHYLTSRMPKFGPKNVESLASLLPEVDRRPDEMPKVDFTEPEYRVKAAGRHLIGGQALSCIKCHDFGVHPSTGVRAISLTTMYQRLRPDWFYRYMLNPQVYRRGTRMPAPWPSGQVTIRDVLNGDLNQQVEAVWLYLSDRDKAALPVGLVRESIELKPQTDPIIYRNFLEGAGTRAVGVGYPEGVNLAFDANNMRLAMIWHGAFLDASRHWTGRGKGFEPPLGDDIIPLPDKAPFVVLDKPDREVSTESARDLGYHFHGFHLDGQQRPIFRYSMPGLMIEDHSVPLKGTGKWPALKRSIQLEGNADTKQLWYVAARGNQVEEVDEGRYRIDNVWTLEASSSSSQKPIIRTSGGKKELLIPVRLNGRKAGIALQYVW